MKPRIYRVSVRDGIMANPVISVYKKLPEERKKLISDYLSVLKKLARCGTELRFKIYEDLDGKKLVYATSDEPDTGYIECFFPGVTVTRVGTVYAWSLRKFASQHDKVIIDMHSNLARFFTDGIISVRWIRQAYDLAIPLEELFKHRERRRERKKVLTFQPAFSTDPEDLEFFYEKMYLPFIQKRHSDAIILKKVFLQQDMKKGGELCFIKKDGQIASGGFCTHVGDSYNMLILGMADEKYVEEGAVAALFYYGLHRALEKEARYFDFGLTRPFITDGVCIYKRKWGGRIQRDPDTPRVLYLKNITKDGLIILDDEKLKVLVSEDNMFCRQHCSDAGIEAKII
jgi:hypothetical protein